MIGGRIGKGECNLIITFWLLAVGEPKFDLKQKRCHEENVYSCHLV